MSWKTLFMLVLTNNKWIRLMLRRLELLEDIKWFQPLSPLNGRYVPWTGSAMRPGALQMILNDIAVNRRTKIVELGGGLSTIYICRLLTQMSSDGVNRKIVCIEHDGEWVKILTNILRANEVSDDLFEIMHCPLTSGAGSPWYTENEFMKTVTDIELLLIDGPPAYRKEIEMAREPALPYFFNKLSENASVYLDDIDRSGERKVAYKWCKKFNISISVHRLRGSFAVFRKSASHFNV